MPKTKKITFSKMDQDPFEGTGHITIYFGDERRGWIEKASTAEDVGHTTSVYKYIADTYEVNLWHDFDDDEVQARIFEVSAYKGPRTALAAAKQWARETLAEEAELRR